MPHATHSETTNQDIFNFCMNQQNMKQIFAEAYIYDLSVYHVNASNRPPTFCYAAPPINIQEVSVYTRAV